MKIKNIFSIIIVLLFSLFPELNYGQIMKNHKFKTNDLILNSITKDGTIYDNIQLKDADQEQTIGNPDLPVYHCTFYVPLNENAISIIFKSKKQDVIFLKNDLFPSQQPIPTSINQRDIDFNTPNKVVYESDSAYPTLQAHICHTDYIDGDLKFVTVEVYPMQYYPKSKKIIYSSEFELKLETTKDDNSDRHKIHPKKRNNDIINILKSLVENPQTITLDSSSIITCSISSPSKVMAKVARTSWAVPFYEYVIVTSNALKDSFNDLLTWKRQKGYNAGVVSIEDILSDPMATGDTISNLYDNAGKLRQYLGAGFAAGITKYALLGGDYSVLPVRYGCGRMDTWDYGHYSNGSYVFDLLAQKIPSDLYFSDFNGNWNVDGDIYTGEYTCVSGDLVDQGPEIFVGRLLCSSISDVVSWTKKQLIYEQNPGNGHYDYLNRALFTQSDDAQKGQEAESVKTVLPLSITATILNEIPSYNAQWPIDPKGSTIISRINNTQYGLLSNFNHGGPIDYGTATHGIADFGHDYQYGVYAADAYDLNDAISWSTITEPGNGFDNLTNYVSPAIMYSVSCTNMPFDDWQTPTETRNLAEAFTTMFAGGGIAYLGNTRYGWVGSSYKLYKAFLNSLSSTNNLGKAEAYSKSNFVGHWHVLSHNLVGCPETPMWTATPSLFGGVTILKTGTTLTVNTNIVSKICVTSASDAGQTYYQVKDNISCFIFTNVPSDYKVVITRTNYIPYIFSSDCYLQNETYSGISTINAARVSAGTNVISSKPTGPVIIQSGANVTFNVDEAVLTEGFEVQAGGQLEIK